jgi:hypothetical protein
MAKILSLWYRMINFAILVAGLTYFLPILISGMYGLYSLNRNTAFAWKCRRHWFNKIGFIILPQEGSSAEFENFVFLIKNGSMQNVQPLLPLFAYAHTFPKLMSTLYFLCFLMEILIHIYILLWLDIPDPFISWERYESNEDWNYYFCLHRPQLSHSWL